MSQSKTKAVRKHLNDNHHAWVEARWRRPMRWLPGLKSDWFGIMLFPKLQPLFKYRMIHAITTGPFEANDFKAHHTDIDTIIQGETDAKKTPLQ